MVSSAIAQIFALLLELVRISRISDHDKDLEILVLSCQLSIADRKLNRTKHIQKLTLAVLAARLKSRTNRTTNQLQHTLRIFSLRTVIRWHNDLVKHKWIYAGKNKGGRPRSSQDVEALILHLARENTYWGYGKIAGELVKLGLILANRRFATFSIATALRRQPFAPEPPAGDSS